jgi:uncharacterized membrane protein YadS
VFGIWAGLSMFSTGPVTAAGFAFSEVAGQWATLTKLTRNVLLGAVVLAYSVVYTSGESAASADAADSPAETDGSAGTDSTASESDSTSAGTDSTSAGTLRRLWQSFPKFVVGFVSVMVLASSGALTAAEIDALARASHYLFLAAFAGLGLGIDASDLRQTGVRPVAALFVTLVVVSVVSLTVVRFLF